MKTIRKVILIILTSLMVCTSVCVYSNTNYIKAEDEPVLGEPQDIVKKGLEISTAIAGILSGFSYIPAGGLVGFAGGMGGVVGTLSLIFSIVGPLLGRESDEEAMTRRLFDQLQNIDSKLDTIDSKLTTVENSVYDTLVIIYKDFNEGYVSNCKDRLDVFNGKTNYLVQEMNNLNSKAITQVRDWYLCNTAEELYNKKFVDEKKKFVASYTDASKNIVYVGVDASDIIDAFGKVKTGGYYQGWDPDKCDEIMRKVFTAIQDKYLNGVDMERSQNVLDYYSWLANQLGIEASKTIDDILLVFNGKPEEDKNKIKEKFLATCIDSLINNAVLNIAGTTRSDFKTYADEIIDLFGDYCNRIATVGYEAKNSPINIKYDLMSKLYPFQGDLYCSYTYNKYKDDGTYYEQTVHTNMASLAAEQYKANITKLGAFAALLSKASNNATAEDLQRRLYIPWAKALDYIEKAYKEFYNDDKGDNYCYMLGQKIEYQSSTLSSKVNMKFYGWHNGFGTEIRSYRETYMNPDWSFSTNNNAMVSSAYLKVLYQMYESLKRNGTIDSRMSFADYLSKNYVNVDSSNPVQIVTQFHGGQGFSSGDSFPMFVHNAHEYASKYKNVDSYYGDVATITGSTDYLTLKSKAVADVFDLTNGVASSSVAIGAVAGFYEKWTFKDDLTLFWDATYKNPRNKNEYSQLYRSEYWRNGVSRYDDDDDPEERYNAYINYSRNYGTLVKKNVESSTYLKANSGFRLMNSAPRLNFSYSLKDEFASLQENQADLINLINDPKYLLSDIFKKEKNEIYDRLIELYNKYIDDNEIEGYQKVENFDNVNATIFYNDEDYNPDDDEIIAKFEQYISKDEVLQSIVKDFFTLEAKYKAYGLQKQNVDVSNEELEELIDIIICDVLECKIINNESELPSVKDAEVYYDFNTGEAYCWYEDKYVKASDFGEELFEINDLPYVGSRGFKVELRQTLITGFKLDLDQKGNAFYSIIPVFDVTPYLVWDGGEIQIEERTLKNFEIDNIEVKLPILINDNKDGNCAEVYHYDSIEKTYHPDEIYEGRVVEENGLRYVVIGSKQFSPFYINSVFYSPKVPDTGVNDISTKLALASLVAIAGLLIVKKKREE